MSKNLIVLLSLFGVFVGSTIQAQNMPNINYTPLQMHSFESTVLREERMLNFWIPNGYNDSTEYQIVYVLDGSLNEDFIHIAGLVQFFSLQFSMEPTIVVGIANVDRKRDFTFEPTVQELKEKYPTTGGSKAFMDFLEMEVKPYVEGRFKTNGTDFLVGQSLGGLLASEVLLRRPELFSHYIIVSPSMWWNDESLLHKAEEVIARKDGRAEFVSISVGKEGIIMHRGAKGVYKAIKSTNKADRLIFNKMRKENHASILHLAVYEALQELYPRP